MTEDSRSSERYVELITDPDSDGFAGFRWGQLTVEVFATLPDPYAPDNGEYRVLKVTTAEGRQVELMASPTGKVLHVTPTHGEVMFHHPWVDDHRAQNVSLPRLYRADEPHPPEPGITILGRPGYRECITCRKPLQPMRGYRWGSLDTWYRHEPGRTHVQDAEE